MSTELEILAEIRDLLKSQSHSLGFGHPPKPRYIYANRQYPNCLWYFWNGGKNEHEPIEYHAVTGTIEKLEIETKEFRGKPDPKVNLTIRADRTYIIQAGFDTLFAKGLLFTLSKLPPQVFRQPITIAVEPGETEQVLFCRIYNPSTGNSVYAPYPDDVDWASVTQRVISKIEQGKGGSSVESPKIAAQVNPASNPEPNLSEHDLGLEMPQIQDDGIWVSIQSWLSNCDSAAAVEQLWVNLQHSKEHWPIIQQYDAKLTVEAEFSRVRRTFQKQKTPIKSGAKGESWVDV
jgi:hypothetical protein